MNVTVVYTGDEEDPGKEPLTSREALLAAARESYIALAFEGATPGKAVIGRRGIASWHMQVTGEQAHSSGLFSDGYGAIFEAAVEGDLRYLSQAQFDSARVKNAAHRR